MRTRQQWCETKDSYTNCGCEDNYLYLVSLLRQQQHIESTSIVEVVLAVIEIESDIHVYQSIGHAIERGVRSCRNSDVPIDPYFDVGQEIQCWRLRHRPGPLEDETHTQSKRMQMWK